MNKLITNVWKSKLFSSFGVYFGSTLFNAALPFLMLPIFTRFLSKTDYGIVSMFTVLCGFLMPFMGFSTIGILSREYFNRNKTDFKLYVGNIFIILFLSVIPIFLILLISSPDIANLAEIPQNVIWLVLVFSFFSFLLNIALTIWQVQSKAIRYGIFQIGQTVINVLLTVAFVVWLHLGWQGRIWAQVLAVVSVGLICFCFLIKNNFIKLKFNKIIFKDSLRFGLPLIPHTLGAIIFSMSDRFFITNMVGIESTGVYAVGYSIGSIIGFIEHSFNLAYAPWLFEKLSFNNHDIKKKIVKYTYIYFILILLLAFFLTVSAPFIFRVFIDKKFEASQVYVFWIALSFSFSGMYKMVTNYIFYVKKTHILAWVTFASALINIVLNYFLVKKCGAIGAAISTLIINIIFFFLTWILSDRLYKMPWLLK